VARHDLCNKQGAERRSSRVHAKEACIVTEFLTCGTGTRELHGSVTRFSGNSGYKIDGVGLEEAVGVQNGAWKSHGKETSRPGSRKGR